MTTSDPISDMLVRIRNAGRVLHPTLRMPHSRIKVDIASVLKREGYIEDYSVEEHDSNKKSIGINLKYKDKRHVIDGMKRISRPSCRVYVGADEIPRVLAGLGIVIMTTPAGVITGKEAKKLHVGGELLCTIW